MYYYLQYYYTTTVLLLYSRFGRQQAPPGGASRANDPSDSNAERGGGNGNTDGETVRLGMVVGRDPRGLGYAVRFESPQGFDDELVAWDNVTAIR